MKARLEPHRKVLLLFTLAVYALVSGCGAMPEVSLPKSGYPSNYPVATYTPQLTAPGDLQHIDIHQISQLDGGVGYEIHYRGHLVTKSMQNDSTKMPDIKLNARFIYTLGSGESYALNGISPVSMSGKETLRYFISSSCIEGNYGGCKTKSPPEMSRALTPIKIDFSSMREVRLELSFTDARSGEEDMGNGTSYKIFFAENGRSNYQTTVPKISLAGNVLLSSFSGGIGLGCYGQCGFVETEILVKNLGYHKNVGIVYQYLDAKSLVAVEPKMKWDTISAGFSSSESSGYERWKVTTNLAAKPNFVMEFAVFYKINGETYWDNNNGDNYIWDSGKGKLITRD